MNGVVEEIKVTIVIVGQDMVPSFLGLLHLDRTVKSWELLHQDGVALGWLSMYTYMA